MLKLGTVLAAATVAFSATMSYAQANLTAHTGGVGTTVHVTATALVEYAAERGIANIQLKDGQTGTKYTPALAEGQIDIISGPFALPFLMAQAAGPFAGMDKDTGAALAGNIRLLYPYTLSAFSMYAFDAKGISGWSDLAGKKILNGPPRGSATLNSRSLVQFFSGLKSEEDYESFTVNWDQMAGSIIDGSVDAAVIPVMFPGPRVTRTGAAGAMTLYSMPKEPFESEAIQRFLNKPGSVPFVAPVSQIEKAMGDGWTVQSEDDMFRAKGVPGGDMVHKDMDEELAYQLTKAHIENAETHKNLAPFMTSLNFGGIDQVIHGLCGANVVTFHPGAVRAWEEAGHTVPDCAKP